MIELCKRHIKPGNLINSIQLSQLNQLILTRSTMLIEGIDYYINADGNLVFTKEYHLKRGYCCKNKITVGINIEVYILLHPN